ncbi:hydroxyethylthiazole kinase [Companilactobacillus zhongbaensis]|uniref:hydroxyethylthiazole kinase n=1 Tax=Companilactobacillus zhongbaensis TaxID=2486009 RepID=UPI0013DDCD1A|nr:hydroxyethylthiazole kinase [Companilactobacillus zhongbaensis]
MQFDLLNKVRTDNPMVLNIANSVTQSDVANGISAIGSSPLMTNYDEELKTLAQFANGICINIGTLDQRQNELSLELLRLANQFNKPVVLDPVGIGAVPERLSFAEELLRNGQPTVIRGNAGEVASLVGVSWSAKGIDSIDDGHDQSIDEMAQACAKKFSCVTVVTGETDTIATADEVAHVFNGHKMFTTRVGTGDMLSSLIAVFAGVSTDNVFEAAKMACLVFGLAGQTVMDENPEIGPAEFSARLLDKLYSITTADVEQGGKFDEGNK